MSDIEKCRKRRTTHRWNVLKIVNKVYEILKTDEIEFKRLKCYKEDLIVNKGKLRTFESETLELIIESEEKETANKDIEDTLVYKEKLSCCMQSYKMNGKISRT